MHPILGQLEFFRKMDEKMISAKIFQSEDAVLPRKSLFYPLIINLKGYTRWSIGTLQIVVVEFLKPSVFAQIQKTTSGELDQSDALNSFAAFLELSRARLLLQGSPNREH